MSADDCTTGNGALTGFRSVAPGTANPTRSLGVVPTNAVGVVGPGRRTPNGDYVKLLWLLRSPARSADIEVRGRALATGEPLRWATVRADNAVVTHRRVVGGAPLEGDWTNVHSAVLYPRRGCYEFRAVLRDGTPFGRIRLFYEPGPR
jgi:hypothetical protein